MALTEEQINIALTTSYDAKGMNKFKKDLYDLQNNRLKLNAPATDKEKEKALGTVVRRQEQEKQKAQKKALVTGFTLIYVFNTLSRVTQGLLRPAAEAAGLFDIIGAILTILFLPAMLALLPLLLGLLKFVLAMPQPVKLLVGGFVLLIAAIAQIGVLLGNLSLLFGGFGGTLSVIEGVLAAIGSALASPLVLLAAAIGLVIVAVLALLSYKDQIIGFFNSIGDMIGKLLGLNPTQQSAQQNILSSVNQGVQEGRGWLGSFGDLPVISQILDLGELTTKSIAGVEAPFLAKMGVGQPNQAPEIKVNVYNSQGIQSTVGIDQIGSAPTIPRGAISNSVYQG